MAHRSGGKTLLSQRDPCVFLEYLVSEKYEKVLYDCPSEKRSLHPII